MILFLIFARFRTRASLEAELVALRHQVTVLHRGRRSRPRLNIVDCLIWIWLYRLSPGCLDTLVIVRPETVVRWHRAGFPAWWHWKSPARGGRPRIDPALRRLTREMSRDNPIVALDEAGYAFDYISDAQVEATATANGVLVRLSIS